MRIWKYPIHPGENELYIPEGADILTAQTLDGEPCLWALCDPNNRVEARKFLVVPTGRDFKGDRYRFINTFQVVIGQDFLVFHLFEEK